MFFQIHAPGKCFISSIMSKLWWYAFHRQHKPPSSLEQRIFPLIFIVTIRQVFCLSPLPLMRIWCQFFPSWVPFDHSNFSLRLRPHSPIKPDWSDLQTLNFHCIQFIRSSLRCPFTIDWQSNFFPREPLDQLEKSALTECELKRFSGAFRAGAPSPLECLPRAPVFSFTHYFQAPAT